MNADKRRSGRDAAALGAGRGGEAAKVVVAGGAAGALHAKVATERGEREKRDSERRGKDERVGDEAEGDGEHAERYGRGTPVELNATANLGVDTVREVNAEGVQRTAWPAAGDLTCHPLLGQNRWWFGCARQLAP